jgi:hypothetical protein
MANFAIVENESLKVVNVIVWEGSEWLPPRDHLVIASDQANIGDIYDKELNVFKKPLEQDVI